MEPLEKTTTEPDKRVPKTKDAWNKLRSAFQDKLKAKKEEKFAYPIFPKKVLLLKGKLYYEYYLGASISEKASAMTIKILRKEDAKKEVSKGDKGAKIVDVTGTFRN